MAKQPACRIDLDQRHHPVLKRVTDCRCWQPGQRQSVLHERFDQLVHHNLECRVLVFDADAASQAARPAADCKARGRPVDMREAFIAAVALAGRATLTTRNVRHFDDLFVPVINPSEDKL